MAERQTVAQSKSIFHKEFPYVVPSVYRRIIDELLVELNLLQNQSRFKADGAFAVGLKTIFDEFR